MIKLDDFLADLKTEVEKLLRAGGHDPAFFDLDNIVNVAVFFHGRIIQDYHIMRRNGTKVELILDVLTRKYHPLKRESIRSIIKRNRQGVQQRTPTSPCDST